MPRSNEFGQPIGDEVPNWKARAQPEAVILTGRTCQLEPVNVEKHADDLYAAYSTSDGRDFTYMPFGSFSTADEYRKYAEFLTKTTDPRHFAIIDLASKKAVGTISLMHIDPANGVVEVGYVTFSPLLKQSILSTEAQYLLMGFAFDQLGYRRYEWKCDNLNAPSRKAAARLGFTFEGVFRHHQVYKGRNRDTAWFSIITDEWPRLKVAFQSWLSPQNFDDQGRQIKALATFREK